MLLFLVIWASSSYNGLYVFLYFLLVLYKNQSYLDFFFWDGGSIDLPVSMLVAWKPKFYNYAQMCLMPNQLKMVMYSS